MIANDVYGKRKRHVSEKIAELEGAPTKSGKLRLLPFNYSKHKEYLYGIYCELPIEKLL